MVVPIAIGMVATREDARMVELVDTPDLKSCACMGVRVQVPLRVH